MHKEIFIANHEQVLYRNVYPDIEHAGPPVGEGEDLGRRDAIQPCPLSKTLDDSPSLQSWEHFLCGLIQARRTLARTATAAPLKASARHARAPQLHEGNPGRHP